MAKVLTDDSNYTAIANAIRAKKGVEITYRPSEMAGAISSIETANLDTLSVNANGTYTPTSPKNGFSEVTVAVPNSYGVGDEGKVVSNATLVTQGSQTITENGTYDTTLKNEVVVNVSGGGGSAEIIDIFGSPSANVGDNYEITSDRGVYSTAYQYYAFNNLGGNNVWGSATNATPAWIIYKFTDGKKRVIKVFGFQTLVSAFGGGFSATAFQLQGSNDDFNTYDVLFSYSGGASTSPQYVLIESNNAYLAFRIYITSIYQDRYPALNKIKAYGYIEQ